MCRRLFLLFILCVVAGMPAWACTSAVVSGRVTPDGRPLLWKHRDASDLNNRIVRFDAVKGQFSFVGVVNGTDTLAREVWTGYNSVGFAVMNTAVYNLKDDTVTQMDREGLLMTEALRRCATVDDFELLLRRLPKPLGVEANFGVIDAQGNGAYFETDNWDYVKYDLADAPDGVLVRTNYAHSGRKGEGKGHTREGNALHLLKPHIANGDISAELLTETLSRSFYSSRQGMDYTHSEATLQADQEFIPRPTSCATVVIEGIMPGESPRLTTMWVGLGYPPCSEIRVAWLGNDGVPAELRGTGPDGRSPLCDTAITRKGEVFKANGEIDLGKLYNSRGTGYCQVLSRLNHDAYRRGYEAIARKRLQLHGND